MYEKSGKLASHVANSNIAINTLPTLQISVGIIALFEKIYEGEPSSQISGMMYNTVVSIKCIMWKVCRSPTLCRYLKTIIDSKWQKQGSLSSFRPLTDGACTDLFDNFSDNSLMIPNSTHLFSHWSIPLKFLSVKLSELLHLRHFDALEPGHLGKKSTNQKRNKTNKIK